MCSASVAAPSLRNLPHHVHAIQFCMSSRKADEQKSDGPNVDKELKELHGTQLKWSEIDFPTVHDELRAIDEYVKQDNIPEGDAWPIFLRACAYESVGQSQLALAQLSKIYAAAGLAKVPNVWERRAYNTFKIGDVKKADAFFGVSETIHREALGNELHFSHWYEDNFVDFKPKHNGPAFSIQRGVCKYFIGSLDEATSYFVSPVILRSIGHEHAVLWMLASSARNSAIGKASVTDIGVIRNWRKSDTSAISKSISLAIDLYCLASSSEEVDTSELIESLSKIAESDSGDESLVAAIYLALYYDSLSKDDEQRDQWLNLIADLPGGPLRTDSLDFMYHAAKLRYRAVPS